MTKTAKKWMVVGVALCVASCFMGQALAMEQGNDRKGKYTYRKLYAACHARGGIESPKPPLNPDAKTQAQWEQLFDAKEFAEFGCKEEWDKASQEDIVDIFTYLYSHAADSPSPAKCK